MSLAKTQTLDAGTSGLVLKKKRLKSLTLHRNFAFLSEKNTLTELPS